MGEWLEVCLRESWSRPDLQNLLESFFFFKATVELIPSPLHQDDLTSILGVWRYGEVGMRGVCPKCRLECALTTCPEKADLCKNAS